MKTSPTQLSLNHFRKLGYICDKAEYWNSFANQRKDLFGFIDIVCLNPKEKGIIAIQTTSWNHIFDRKKKILGLSTTKPWLEAGGKIIIQGFKKVGFRYEVKEVTIDLQDFN